MLISEERLSERKERKRKKNYASSKKLLTSINEKGPPGKISPFTTGRLSLKARVFIEKQ